MTAPDRPPFRAPPSNPARRGLLAAAAFAAGLVAGSALAPGARAQAAAAEPPLDADEQIRVLESLAAELEQRFVHPEIGGRYAAMLRQRRRAGHYAALRDAAAFAAAVTVDLQAVHPDGHLALRLRDTRTPMPPGSFGLRLPAIERAELLGEVALLAFNLFPDDDTVAATVRRFLTGPAAAAKALVIDARSHRGGSLAVMDALLPLIFATPRTLVRMDARRAAAADGALPSGPTLRPRPAPEGIARVDHVVTPDPDHRALQSVPVFYLTSRRTASAAEHLALALQASGRATLVGEMTRGAGHFGGLVEFGRFAAFVPVGRTYDPLTGQDWEGRGIRPDIEVPAAEALDQALQRLAELGIRNGR